MNMIERHTVKRWMRAQADDFREDRTGEPQYTQLAEAAADHFAHLEWLDDETHPVWDWAIEAFNDNNRKV